MKGERRKKERENNLGKIERRSRGTEKRKEGKRGVLSLVSKKSMRGEERKRRERVIEGDRLTIYKQYINADVGANSL